MKTKLILSIIGFLFITGCSKSADELFELSNDNLKNNEIDQAIIDLETLVSKYPQDSLAAYAQYKLASIQLNWKNNLTNGYVALQTTANNFGESIQGIQAQKEIDQFPEYILNKAESLRKRKMVKEAVDHLMYLTEKYSQHELTPKGQYMLGDLYMNEFRDFTTAVQEYRKVIENFAGSSQEAHALFMIGYIYANVVNDPKSAQIEYNEFLKRFPTHELAPSVKFEIEYLGKGIEEIPALKHITS
jgi:TolA-binding protein